MADPATTVNGQITDSITQVNTKVVGDAPAMSMGSLMTATGRALSSAGHNATYGQQQAMVRWQATTIQGINSLYGMDSAAMGKAIQQIDKT